MRSCLILVLLAACGSDDAATGSDLGPDTTASDTSAADTISATWWRPAPSATWHIQLSGDTDTTRAVAVYDVDMTDVSDADFSAIHARGAKLVCYFSAGSTEEWRDDADDFPKAAIGKNLDGWPGEKWLDIRDPGVRAVLARRLDVAVARGCDAVDPDNINGFENDSGFPLKRADTIDLVRWLAAEGHARGLGVGLKNGGDVAADLIDDVDFEINEECLTYDECDALAPFVASGRAVLHIEYVERQADGPAAQARVCGDARRAGFTTVIKLLALDAWSLDCD